MPLDGTFKNKQNPIPVVVINLAEFSAGVAAFANRCEPAQ
jgi:hypothetical protein